MHNTIDTKARFCICFLANKEFLLFLEGHILPCLIYPMNLIVAFLMNKNKSQLLAALEIEAGKLLSSCLSFWRFLNFSP